ncbi:MAG: beta-galactosidase, partial [Alistipes sp.]|nr:beta-galactosidase [Alistipes sp.]
MKKSHTYTLGLLCGVLTLLATGTLGAQSKLPQKELPILSWHGMPAEESTVARFTEQKEAGFTHNFSFYYHADEVARALDAAQKAGIKLIITCNELHSDPEATVKKFMNHPALAGYFLRDEPLCSDFEALGEWARRIQAVDSKHFCYLNLFPTGDEGHFKALGVANYREYITRFDKAVPLPFISFDHYPITYDGVKPEWYENLNDIAEESQKLGKPFWAFAMATKHWMYPEPTLSMLRLQMYSNLAYGAQGLEYFTYWTPSGNQQFDFREGPIGLDGKRTVVYDRVKALNTELKALSGVFVGAKVISVTHTGEKLPRSARRLETLPAPIK